MQAIWQNQTNKITFIIRESIKEIRLWHLFDWLAHGLGLRLLFWLAVSAGEFTRGRLQSLKKTEYTQIYHHMSIKTISYMLVWGMSCVLYLQRDASVGLGCWGHSVLSVRGVTGEGDQVVVAVAVGDQRGGAVGLQQVQWDGLGVDLGAVLWVDEDRSHLDTERFLLAHDHIFKQDFSCLLFLLFLFHTMFQHNCRLYITVPGSSGPGAVFYI